MDDIVCFGWSAWHDHMPKVPGGPPTLHVTGTCRIRSGGYSLELKPREPQGINPADLLLDLAVQAPPPSDPVTPAHEDHSVHYTEQTEMEYQTATVVGYASMPVEEVH